MEIDNFTYSSTAKQAKKEITDFLENSNDNERLIHKLKDQIYQGDVITKEYLDRFCKENNFDCNIYFKIVRSSDNTGQTILHIVVDAMNVSALAALHELNLITPFINITDKFNMTPMHIAAINFDYEIFNLLRSLSPDMSIKDSEGKTPIDYLKENDDISEDIINEIINQY